MNRATLASVLVAAIVATACTATVSGEPVPGVLPAPPSSPAPENLPQSTPDDHGAPRVDHPLDGARYLTEPCAALSGEQLAGFGVVDPGETSSAVADVSSHCIWHAVPEVNSTIDVGFIAVGDLGLAKLYAERDRQEYFEETTVQEYPAVFHSILDRRPSGACNISVGISNTLFFRTSEQGRTDAIQACARAKSVADAVITTLKRGAS